MRSVALSLVLLSTLALAGCQSKAEKVKTLLAQYNTEYPAYAKDCLDETSGSARMLTGEKLTAGQIEALDAKKKERDARCKPEADRLREIQREILAAQQ
ncbi:MAG: hypothetical protein WB762_12825 [Candidatus Sulfotelmatobacter sp.]